MSLEEYDDILTDYCHVVIKRRISGYIDEEKKVRVLRKIEEWRDAALSVMQ